MRQQNAELIRRLAAAEVAFVIVGGIAAAAHGGSRVTFDLDIVAPFTADNMARLLAALRDVHPRYVTRPDLAVEATAEELGRYRNLYLLTDIGRLDVLGELPPLGGYTEAAATAIHATVVGVPCRVIGLDALITIKESVGREQDKIDVRMLREIRKRRAAQSAS